MIKTIGATLATLVALTLAGCSADEAGEMKPDAGEPSKSVDERIDLVSGKPLRDFEGQASYPWRERLVDSGAELLVAAQEIAPWLDRGDLSDVLGVCSDVDRGIEPARVVENAVTRFSGGTGEKVTAAQAQQLVALSQQHACPAR